MRIRKILIAASAIGLLTWGGYLAQLNIRQSSERDEALELVEKKQFSAAIPKLKVILDRDPGDAEILAVLIESMAATEGYLVTDLMPYLNRWCELRPNDFRPFLKRMNGFLGENRSEEALADAEQVLRLRPDQHEVRCVAARILHDLGRNDDALGQCEILLAAQTIWDDEVRLLAATIHNDKGNRGLAKEMTLAVLSRKPTFEPALMLYGEILFNEGEYQNALKPLTASSQSRILPVRQRSLNLLGRSLAGLGKTEEAKVVFDRLALLQEGFRADEDAKQQPNNWPAQVRAGRALLAADYPVEACAIIERALSRLPPNRDALSLLGDCYEKRGMLREAQQVRQKVKGIE